MLTIFIPIYNEEDNLYMVESELFPALKDLKDAWEILIVDDGSTDTSSARLEALLKKHNSVRVIKHLHNKGLGEAVKTA
ncbi:MAG: glycosyltransferase, partial [Desulfobulbaceae bacterium]|nr:glycosyltransferase [Desulfobulbaceae bacterium]